MHDARIEPWVDPRLLEHASRIHGGGVFASAPIEAGERVFAWGGLLIPDHAYDPATHDPQSTTRYDGARYLTLRRGEPRDLSAMLNHACDANTWMLDERQVIARRPIAAGEEVTTDVALWSDDDDVYTASCRCGSPLCRRVVTGRDWRRPELQERYAGHFIPYLRDRIAVLRAQRARGLAISVGQR